MAGERLAGSPHVIDGDTIVVSGIHVRLKGVAAPEVTHFGNTVICDLTQERTHGRRVGRCYRGGKDIAEALIAAGLARDCPRYSGGRYAAAEVPASLELPFLGYCRPK